MSSYKGHTVFALILSLLFFQNPILIGLTIIGANLPDFDHKFRKEKVYQMIILGLVLFIVLYILNLPYYLGLIVIFLGVVFFFSEHRSFTHSIFGIFTLTATLSLILILASDLITKFTVFPNLNNYNLMSFMVLLLGFLFLNKRLFLLFLPLFICSVLLLPVTGFNYMQLAFAIFLGTLSHIVLDSFTPAGIKLFSPLSSRKVHKKFGLVCICLFFIMFLFYYFNSGNYFVNLCNNFLFPTGL